MVDKKQSDIGKGLAVFTLLPAALNFRVSSGALVGPRLVPFMGSFEQLFLYVEYSYLLVAVVAGDNDSRSVHSFAGNVF